MTISVKSPFFIIRDFLSPLMCEKIIDDLNFSVADVNKEYKSIKMQKTHEPSQAMVFERIEQIIPTLEPYYTFIYKGTEPMNFEWFPQESAGDFVCENSNFLRKKWVRTKINDFTGILFLSDFQETIPFDSEYEVYGGKLEFPQHGFGFNPQRGVIVFFPSDPHFINITTPILQGDLFQVRIHLTAEVPYIYNPGNFPGDYTKWFNDN